MTRAATLWRNAAADEAAAQERRRIEFQKTLGAGTSDYTGR